MSVRAMKRKAKVAWRTFEHMMFQGSKHAAKMEHFNRLEAVGAELNANTSVDRTYYYEVVPKNALELALWLEADRFEHLKITQENVDNQRQAVLEERRERFESQPYVAAQLRLGELALVSGRCNTRRLAMSAICRARRLKRFRHSGTTGIRPIIAC